MMEVGAAGMKTDRNLDDDQHTLLKSIPESN